MATTTIWRSNYNDGVKVDLIDLTFGMDIVGYYLTPTYRIETKNTVSEIKIPKARLNVDHHGFTIKHHSEDGHDLCDFGLGPMPMNADSNNYNYYEKLIETKTKEMTLEEIEKKLGHKVKIVNR